ncbi:hypothetical protein ACEWL1_12200, partial [Polaribacter sp. MF5-112]
MNETIYIKNMVCHRCISSVLAIFTAENYIIESVELGQVVAIKSKNSNEENLKKTLTNIGFKIIDNESDTLI